MCTSYSFLFLVYRSILVAHISRSRFQFTLSCWLEARQLYRVSTNFFQTCPASSILSSFFSYVTSTVSADIFIENNPFFSCFSVHWDEPVPFVQKKSHCAFELTYTRFKLVFSAFVWHQLSFNLMWNTFSVSLSLSIFFFIRSWFPVNSWITATLLSSSISGSRFSLDAPARLLFSLPRRLASWFRSLLFPTSPQLHLILTKKQWQIFQIHRKLWLYKRIPTQFFIFFCISKYLRFHILNLVPISENYILSEFASLQ